MRGYGNTIDVTHAHGVMTRYAHLDSFDVEQGQAVSRGDRIGGMGTTGRSTGVHLHYEVRVNGSPIDPMTYIEAARDVL
jgi:murein DD-endopeptidase MepM/ murein hydrolase activator NlpD